MNEDVSESRLSQLREELHHGDDVNHERIDQIATELSAVRNRLRPRDKDELLPLFDQQGIATGAKTPRWLCHLLGLRHRCAHILLLWKSPALGDLLLLQIRDWGKDNSPGHLDISVGGHMTAEDTEETQQTAFAEMLQELNIKPSDLEGELKSIGGYSHDESRPKEYFHNSEWRDVYIGRLSTEAIGKVRFPDGEVAGIALIPIDRAQNLLDQKTVPMASALRKSLPKCLEALVKRD